MPTIVSELALMQWARVKEVLAHFSHFFPTEGEVTLKFITEAGHTVFDKQKIYISLDHVKDGTGTHH